MTLDEIYDYIGEQHGRTKPIGAFAVALKYQDKRRVHTGSFLEAVERTLFFSAINELTVRTLRNQGQPYYDKVPTMKVQTIKPRADCQFCHGTGEVNDWVPAPFGSGSVPMPSLCECVDEQCDEDADEVVLDTSEARENELRGRGEL